MEVFSKKKKNNMGVSIIKISLKMKLQNQLSIDKNIKQKNENALQLKAE